MSKSSTYSSYKKLPQQEKLTPEQEAKCATIEEIESIEHFRDKFTARYDGATENIIRVFDLYTDWCVPCKSIKSPYAHLQDFYSDKVKFYKINYEKFSKRSLNRNNLNIPTEIDNVSGFPCFLICNSF